MHQPVGKRLCRDNVAGLAVLTISLATALTTIGCGNQYRPVVSAISPIGPAGQMTKYAIAVSSPSVSSLGLVTAVDFSGDTVITTPNILIDPNYFVLNTTSPSSDGYVFNTQGSLDIVPVSNPPTLITSNVLQTTLPVDYTPVSMTAITPASSLASLFIPEASTTDSPFVAVLNGTTGALYDTVDVAPNPVYVVGANGTPRVYVISQDTPGGNGEVDSLEAISATGTSSNTAQIPVGITPVYGVMTTSDERAFILNQGSGTVTVINVPSNAIDIGIPAASATPTMPATPAGTIAVGQNPVWADLDTVNSKLVVLNQGDHTHPGTLSIINIPLCNASAQATNPNCSSTNPVDATGFGQILNTATVGINPSMVSVLQGTDGNAPAAYVINQADGTGTCGSGEGSVTVVDLATGKVSATICGVSGDAATAAANSASNVIFGHPNSVSATGGEPTGKVYVTSSDNTYMSVIYTNTNTVQTHIPLQGNGLRVLVTLQ